MEIVFLRSSFFLLVASIRCFLGCASICYGQDPIYFDHISTDDGLSQSDINCIYQDDQGFMWFATHDGLNKYDGYSFTIYKPENQPGSISSNLIFDIIGDKDGNLWIGTTGSGLNYFDRSTEKFTHYRYREDDEGSLSDDHVTAVHLDKKDRLWVATNKGLNMLDLRKSLDTVVFQHFNPEQEPFITGWDGNAIYTIYEDSKDQLWVGGHEGLYKLSRDENGDIYFRLVNGSIGLPNVNVRCIIEDRSGRLIIGTDDGLYSQHSDADPTKVFKLHDGFFNDFEIDNKNHIWAGSNSGLLYFKSATQSQLPELVDRFTYDPRKLHSLSKNIVKSLFMDKTGIIWVGTNGGGVNKFDPYRKQFRQVRKTLDPNSLSYDKIRSMFEDSHGTLWIGTEGGGLNILSKENDNGEYSRFENFQTILKPFAIAEVSNGNQKTILIGAESTPGLFQIDITDPQKIKESSFVPIPEISHSVFTILEDNQKNIWIGTYGGGVYRWLLDPATGAYKKDLIRYDPAGPSSISSNIIRNIYEDSHNNIWFATGNGLCKLAPEERVKNQPNFEVSKKIPGDTNSLSHNYILAIYESTAGDLWIGTFGGGLNKLVPSTQDQNERFVSYSKVNGLPNNVIKGILEDEEGNLWLSTNQGLSMFDPKSEVVKNYDVNDGLQSKEFQELACLKRQSGELLFGGVNGFNAFYPKNITDNSFEAETVITDFMISNNPVKIKEEVNGRAILQESINTTNEISLKYRENSFSFEFAALHYAAPQKNQFAYKLEGFDKDWIFTSSDKRFATYTNLTPGSYTLKVKASNNDGVWDTTPSEIKIKVTPPLWRTNGAYVIYALLFLGLLLAFRRYTVIRTTEKHQLVVEHLEKEKHEEMQRIKLDFFTNISHEFRTPLTLIKGPLEYLQKKGDVLDEQTVQEQYGLMHKNTDYLLRLVNQLLDFRKLDQGKMKLVMCKGNIVEFFKEIGEPFQFLAHKKRIKYKVNAADKSLETWFDPDALEKIINNLLSNAFKFTPEEGSVTVEIVAGSNFQLPKSLKNRPGISNCVIISIVDSGPGIPPSKINQIFEKFYIERDKKERNSQGAGIGLSFTKNLVELHKGTIDVISKNNRGATFIVMLPMRKEAYLGNPEISLRDDLANEDYIHPSNADSYTIDLNDEIVDKDFSRSRSKLPLLLVVDDNADIRAFIKQSLGDYYTICEAEDGKQGLEMAYKLMPNIILSDILMPVMDGIEFCENVKTRKETSHIPLVMLTAKSSQESEIIGIKTGADDYIRKPFDLELLRLKLANIIKHREELRKRFNREVTLQPKEVTVTSADETFLKQAIEIVEEQMMNTDFSVEMLVREMGLSRSNLYLKFKEITGLSSSEFIRSIRLKRAVQLLENSDLSVKEIMYMTGFNTASYFSKCFKKQFGMIPSEYVRQVQEAGNVSYINTK